MSTTQNSVSRTATSRIKHLAAGIVLAGTSIVAATTAVGAFQGGDEAPVTQTVVEGTAATYEDLRYAAEWARRLEAVHPAAFPPVGSRATYEDLMRAALYAPRATR